ncbi:hypothetical protein [Nocardia sp. NPDC127526]|uniref:hypothetical protein n=1 Tax=Nocardia sp. NPDC127526 TaxID=3345393 RepID=UPI00362A097E
MSDNAYNDLIDGAYSFDNDVKYSDLKLEASVAHKCAQACVDVIGKLLNVKGQSQGLRLQLSSFGTLMDGSTVVAARTYLTLRNQIADDFASAIDGHVNVMQVFIESFVDAGMSYEQTEQQSATDFSDIIAPTKPPSTGAGAFVNPAPPPTDPGTAVPSPKDPPVKGRSSLPIDNPASFKYPDLHNLQNTANPKGANQVALAWKWLANEMDLIFDEFSADINGISDSDWSGQGRQGATNICNQYVTLAKQQTAAMQAIGRMDSFIASQLENFQLWPSDPKNLGPLQKRFESDYLLALQWVYARLPVIEAYGSGANGLNATGGKKSDSGDGSFDVNVHVQGISGREAGGGLTFPRAGGSGIGPIPDYGAAQSGSMPVASPVAQSAGVGVDAPNGGGGSAPQNGSPWVAAGTFPRAALSTPAQDRASRYPSIAPMGGRTTERDRPDETAVSAHATNKAPSDPPIPSVAGAAVTTPHATGRLTDADGDRERVGVGAAAVPDGRRRADAESSASGSAHGR